MFDPIAIAQSFFSHTQTVPASSVVQSPEVRKLCEQNTCGSFGKCWTCPPAVAPLEELAKRFEPFDSLQVVYEVYPLEDSFDWQGMMDAMAKFKKSLHSLKKALGEKASKDEFLVLGAGACGLCPSCSYADGEPCRLPDDAIVSMEACGIDVMTLMRDNNMTYNNGPNTVTYVGAVFF